MFPLGTLWSSAHDQRANATLGVQIWHLRTDRDHYMSNCLNAHDQRANARSAHLIWHSRADRDQFPNAHDQRANAILYKMSGTLRGEIWGLSFAATHSVLVHITKIKNNCFLPFDILVQFPSY